MLVGGPSAREFSLRGGPGIPMEAAQTNIYHAPASRADITRSIRIHNITYNPLTCEEARGAEAPFKLVRVHSTHRGEETGGRPVS